LLTFYEEIFGIASRKMNGESGRGKRAIESKKSRGFAFDAGYGFKAGRPAGDRIKRRSMSRHLWKQLIHWLAEA